MLFSSSRKDDVGTVGTPKWLEFTRPSAGNKRAVKRDRFIDLRRVPPNLHLSTEQCLTVRKLPEIGGQQQKWTAATFLNGHKGPERIAFTQ